MSVTRASNLNHMTTLNDWPYEWNDDRRKNRGKFMRTRLELLSLTVNSVAHSRKAQETIIDDESLSRYGVSETMIGFSQDPVNLDPRDEPVHKG
jgi:hypothetical protein